MTYIICTNEIMNLVNSPGISKNDRNINETIQERQSAYQWGKYRTFRDFGTPQGASLDHMWTEELKTFDGDFNAVPEKVVSRGIKFQYTGHYVDPVNHKIYLTYAEL